MTWPSFRIRILLIVLALGSVPPVVLGVWLTRSTVSSGEEIVQSRLDAAIEQAVPGIVSRWIGIRSSVLDLTDGSHVRRLLERPDADAAAALLVAVDGLPFAPVELRLRDREGRIAWQLRRSATPQPGGLQSPAPPSLPVSFQVQDHASGVVLGELQVDLTAAALLPDGAAPEGMLVGLYHAESGTSLIPRPFDRALARQDRVQWGGEEWKTARHAFDEPPVMLALAAPRNPFEGLLAEKARTGVALLVLVSVIGLLLAIVITMRLTRSLDDLASAVEAVSRGELERTVDGAGPPEIGRIARAFNAMTSSLQETLAQLARRESLAAVGEFAASIAHEVRNPLTAIRVDLERVEEHLPEDSPLRPAHERALREVARLDATVSEALQGARGNAFRPGMLDLREPLRAAVDAASHDFDAACGSLSVHAPDLPVDVQGDAGALEQLFLNLLRNAAQAVEPGGSVTVRIQLRDGLADVAVHDDGSGMSPDSLQRAFEPMFTTRAEGTGLGLTIARRIAVAHRGSLTLESAPGEGTTARLTLPFVGEEA
jgi:signal transduction histidine kinase